MYLMQQYKQWVRTNSNLIGAIEGALSSLTWLLPDRFSDSELSLEAFNSLLGLLALYHESILQEPVSNRDQKQPVPWPLWLGAIQQVDVAECRRSTAVCMFLSHPVWHSTGGSAH